MLTVKQFYGKLSFIGSVCERYLPYTWAPGLGFSLGIGIPDSGLRPQLAALSSVVLFCPCCPYQRRQQKSFVFFFFFCVGKEHLRSAGTHVDTSSQMCPPCRCVFWITFCCLLPAVGLWWVLLLAWQKKEKQETRKRSAEQQVPG